MGPWALLACAIGTEVVATLSLRASKDAQGIAQISWYGFVVAGYVASFVFLALVLKKLELGIAYAVWAGVGTAATAVLGVILFGEAATAIKFGCIALIVIGVVGLNLAGGGHH